MIGIELFSIDLPLWAIFLIVLIFVIVAWKIIKFAIKILFIFILVFLIMMGLDVLNVFDWIQNTISSFI